MSSGDAGWRQEVPLFGGAIICDLLSTFEDTSKFRDVPDHQEVWVDTSTDQSFIVEILERKADIDDDRSVEFFLSDLASANEASANELVSNRRLSDEEVPCLPAEATCFLGKAHQQIAKFKEDAANSVHVYLCAIRLAAQKTDILITLNDPRMINPHSSSAGLPTAQGPEVLFERVLRSFRIVDMNLFGEP
eukprot:TRINITY_DN69766_c0_g1_i1.p1 TRINITY_DN69766_c0_g1~~TRINITY_DN69766_c0_g1_i1.p1  ORF type:complete len:191 (+),score=34.08 TRINITY_DN69766_c0_g1_i1:38-610(+)